MSVGVAQVLGWRPDELHESAARFDAAREQVEQMCASLGDAQGQLPGVWQGYAGRAASSELDDLNVSGADLAEALGFVTRVLVAAGDALGAGRDLVQRASDWAGDEGAVLCDDGRVLPPPPIVLPADADEVTRSVARRQHRDRTQTAEDIERMAHAGLEAAQEADEDAASALSQCWQVARLGHGPSLGAGLVAAVLERALPPEDAEPSEVAAWWASLSDSTRALMEEREWARLGNLDGIPLDVRVRANRRAITAALAQEQDREAQLREQIAELERQIAGLDGSYNLDKMRQVEDLRLLVAERAAELDDCRSYQDWYDKLLNERHQIVYSDGRRESFVGHQVVLFDPAGGRFGEIVGNITRAGYVNVHVPGTGSTAGPTDRSTSRAQSFVELADPPGSLAVITYIGGPMPQSIPEATLNSYADKIGPRLARFVNGIDRAPGTAVSVLGHSYGGAIMGTAELSGMRADRVMHVESAGMGAGLGGDRQPDPDIPRYSMTAPGDPIAISQGVSLGGLGHGPDPDTYPGVRRVESGYENHADHTSPIVEGTAAHSGVFDVESTAFVNMLGFMTDGQIVCVDVP